MLRCTTSAIGAGLLALSFPISAGAHAPPEATGIYWQPTLSSGVQAERVFVRTNRGLITATPAGMGRVVSLLCNEAWEASLSETAPVLVTPEAILLGSYTAGLTALASDSCSVSTRGLPLAGRHLIDLSGAGGEYYALTSATETEGGILFGSDDGGAHWQARSSELAFGTALRQAPSKSSRVYVSQQRITADGELLNELAVSNDSGVSFSAYPIPLRSDEVRPFVVGVDPLDADRVFVRTLAADPGLPERLLVSEDAGQTFELAASAIGPLAFAIDAERAWLGSRVGMLRSSDRGSTFTPLAGAPERVGCIAEHAGHLYVCGYANQEFAVLRSADGGESFEPFLRFPEVEHGVDCADDTPVASACAAAVEDWQSEQLGGRESEPVELGGGGSVSDLPIPEAESPNTASRSRCSFSYTQSTQHWGALVLGLLTSALLRRARRSVVSRH